MTRSRAASSSGVVTPRSGQARHSLRCLPQSGSAGKWGQAPILDTRRPGGPPGPARLHHSNNRRSSRRRFSECGGRGRRTGHSGKPPFVAHVRPSRKWVTVPCARNREASLIPQDVRPSRRRVQEAMDDEVQGLRAVHREDDPLGPFGMDETRDPSPAGRNSPLTVPGQRMRSTAGRHATLPGELCHRFHHAVRLGATGGSVVQVCSAWRQVILLDMPDTAQKVE